MPATATAEPALRIEVPRPLRPLLAPARYKGAHGGRGGCKSHFYAGLLIARAMSQPGLRAVCIREVQRSLEQSVKRLLEDKIEALGVGAHFRVLNTHIETPGGGIIIFQGMQNHTAESIKSLEGYDLAWVEEAQALSQRSLDLLRPTIRKEGSELWFSWNPRSASDPVDAFLRGENPPPASVVVKTSWRDNPWLPDELRAELEWDRRRDPAKYAHVWDGEYLQRTEALVFRNWEAKEFDTPADARFYFGGDWGFSVDPAVLVRCWIDGRKLYIDGEAYAVGCEIDYLPFLFGGCEDGELQTLCADAWKAIPRNYQAWRGIEGARKWPIIADSQRPDTISYLKRHGFPKIEPATKGAGSVEEGVEWLQSYDVVVHPRCRHTIDELSTYSYKTDRLTDEVLPVLEDSRNHVIDSVRYAVEKVRRGRLPSGTCQLR
jgi:phage terminase large subunit